MGSPSHSKIIQEPTNWPEGKDGGMVSEEVLRRLHHITNCQITRSEMPCSLMGPVVLLENTVKVEDSCVDSYTKGTRTAE